MQDEVEGDRLSPFQRASRRRIKTVKDKEDIVKEKETLKDDGTETLKEDSANVEKGGGRKNSMGKIFVMVSIIFLILVSIISLMLVLCFCIHEFNIHRDRVEHGAGGGFLVEPVGGDDEAGGGFLVEPVGGDDEAGGGDDGGGAGGDDGDDGGDDGGGDGGAGGGAGGGDDDGGAGGGGDGGGGGGAAGGDQEGGAGGDDTAKEKPDAAIEVVILVIIKVKLM
jgi:hypothetical protein